jgi:hypothetical protein
MAAVAASPLAGRTAPATQSGPASAPGLRSAADSSGHAIPAPRPGAAADSSARAIAAPVPSAADSSARAIAAPVPSAADSSARALPAPHPAAATLGRRSAAPTVAPEDTAGLGLDLVRAVTAANDTARVRIHHGRFDTPRWVMLRSLAFPGWGQLQNRAWIKAVLLGGLDAYLRVMAVDNELWIRRHEGPVRGAQRAFMVAQDSLRQYTIVPNPDTTITNQIEHWNPIYLAASDRYNQLVGPYNARLDQQVSQAWILGGVLIYAIVDAYVDAHFRDFKIEFEHDPALPGGRPPSGQSRLSLRWTF